MPKLILTKKSQVLSLHNWHVQVLAHKSQHLHATTSACALSSLISNSLTKYLLRHSPSLSLQYAFTLSSTCDTESLTALKSVTVAGRPSLPALPVSWMYVSRSSGAPQWIMWRTFGQSRPIPKAIVATISRNTLCGCWNCFRMVSFTSGWVHAVYMSTILNSARVG